MFRTFLLYNIFYDLKTPFLKFLHFARNHFSEFSMWNNFSFLINYKMFHVEHFFRNDILNRQNINCSTWNISVCYTFLSFKSDKHSDKKEDVCHYKTSDELKHLKKTKDMPHKNMENQRRLCYNMDTEKEAY